MNQNSEQQSSQSSFYSQKHKDFYKTDKVEKPENERKVDKYQQKDKASNELNSLDEITSEKLSANAEHERPVLETVVLTEYLTGLDALSGSLRSRLYDSTGNMIKEIPIRDLLFSVQSLSGIHAIVLDGVITQRLVELAVQKGVKAIYGLRANPMPKKHQEILLYTKEHGQE